MSDLRRELKKTIRYDVNYNTIITVTVRIPADILDEVDKLVAEGWAISRSEFIRNAIWRELERVFFIKKEMRRRELL